jgi:hypothetical protein
MPYKRREHDRACRCDRGDGGCAALAVQRLSRTRVQELAEEIWTVSTGTTVPVRPLLDPRGSRPGGSAHAAYQRCRHKEREQWRDGWWWPWRSLLVAAAALGGGLLAGLPMGAWLGWRVAVLAGLLAWWRLRFHPSATARFWRRQAQMQRRTAATLAQLEQEGWLVLHDVALPGWSASLDQPGHRPDRRLGHRVLARHQVATSRSELEGGGGRRQPGRYRRRRPAAAVPSPWRPATRAEVCPGHPPGQPTAASRRRRPRVTCAGRGGPAGQRPCPAGAPASGLRRPSWIVIRRLPSMG